MSNVVAIDDHRAHLVISCGEHEHVVAVATMLDVAAGKLPMMPDCVMRRITVEWLACSRSGCIEHALADIKT